MKNREDRAGDYIGTYYGGRFWVEDPRIEDVVLEEIAHAISLNCRFNGHTKHLWTVAQHSLLVTDLLMSGDISGVGEGDIKYTIGLIGLLHDTSEGYMSDIPRPFKKTLEDYLEIEGMVQTTIYEAFGLDRKFTEDPDILDLVKTADDLALHIEAAVLMDPCDDWLGWGDFKNPLIDKWKDKIVIENPQVVKGKFIKKAIELMDKQFLLGRAKVLKNIDYDILKGCEDGIPLVEGRNLLGCLRDHGCKYRIRCNGSEVDIDKDIIDNSQNIVKIIKDMEVSNGKEKA